MARATSTVNGTPTEGGAATTAQPATRQAWVVVYPQISVLPQDEFGNVAGDFRVFTAGQILTADCEYRALQLATLGMVRALAVPA